MYNLIKKRKVNENEIAVDQGDIYQNVTFFNNVELNENEKKLEIDEYNFDKVLVLSQSCDLHREQENIKNDKEILTVLVVPLFDVEEFKKGEHLNSIKKKCDIISDKLIERYTKGEHERYYVIELKDSDKTKYKIPDNFIIDFRYFFTVNIKKLKKEDYLMSLDDLFKEKVTQRFCNYLSRIGLPVINNE